MHCQDLPSRKELRIWVADTKAKGMIKSSWCVLRFYGSRSRTRIRRRKCCGVTWWHRSQPCTAKDICSDLPSETPRISNGDKMASSMMASSCSADFSSTRDWGGGWVAVLAVCLRSKNEGLRIQSSRKNRNVKHPSISINERLRFW